MDTEGSRPKGAWGRIAEVGPLWLSAVAALIVALTGAGFFAGRITAPPNDSAGRAPSSAVPSASPRPAPSATPATARGAERASYDVTLALGYGFNVKPTPPTQVDLLGNNAETDIRYTRGGGDVITIFSRDKLVMLPPNTEPTYAACKANLVFVGAISKPQQGTTWCVLGNGTVVGVQITDISDVSPLPATLHLTIWADS